MTEQPQAPQVPPQISMDPLALVQPSPVQPLTGIGTGPQGNFVLVRYETVVGSIAIPLTPEEAVAHGEDLVRRGKAAKSGLTLPPGVRL